MLFTLLQRNNSAQPNKARALSEEEDITPTAQAAGIGITIDLLLIVLSFYLAARALKKDKTRRWWVHYPVALAVPWLYLIWYAATDMEWSKSTAE